MLRLAVIKYIAIGKMNDGNEQGKSCILIGDSVSDIDKLARNHGVYEFQPADEYTGTILVTYAGNGTGLRAWFSNQELQEALKEEIMGKPRQRGREPG